MRPIAATGMALLVLALAIFAACPAAHHWLHHSGGTPAEDDCAVAIFSGGVSAPAGPVQVSAPSHAWQAATPGTAPGVFVTPPRYIRQPERGPPALG